MKIPWKFLNFVKKQKNIKFYTFCKIFLCDLYHNKKENEISTIFKDEDFI